LLLDGQDCGILSSFDVDEMLTVADVVEMESFAVVVVVEVSVAG
jgi:hypothetical protein